MRAAAATTAAEYFLPGWRVVRSIGPLTLTAAITDPSCPRTGALTEATPASRSATLSAHPRFSDSGSPRRMRPGGAHVEGQRGAERHDRAQTVGRLERLDAHAAIAVAHVQLRALARRVAQCSSAGLATSGSPKPMRSRAPERDEAEPEREATVRVPAHQAVRFERGREPVRGRTRQAGHQHELGERAGLALERAEHGHRLVEHADAAYAAAHNARL